MKILELFSDFFTHNRIKLYLLLIIMTSAMIMLSESIGQFHYYQYEKSFFLKDELKDSVFVQVGNTYTDIIVDENGNPYDWDSDEFDEKNSILREQIKNEHLPQKSKTFSAVEDVYGYTESLYPALYEKESAYIQFASEKTYEIFDYQLSAGSWFKDCKQTSEYPNAVLCGNLFKNVPIGSDIEIGYKESRFKIHVIGKTSPPHLTFHFGDRTMYDSEDSTGFSETSHKTTCIFLLNNQFTQNYLSNYISEQTLYEPTMDFNSFFVKFKETASKEEIDTYLDYLSQYGSNAYINTNTLVESTEKYVKGVMIDSVPLSLFYAIISTFTTICVSTIIVRKKLSEHYSYYICGCSRKKSFALLVAGLSYIEFVSFILTSAYLILKNVIIIYVTSNPHMIIDYYSYLYAFLYATVCLLLSLIMPFWTFRKHTPIELYRNKDGRI